MATIFFDLDGTLIDSAVGITRCVAHALRTLGEPVPPDSELRGWIGPALRDSFGPLLGDAGHRLVVVTAKNEPHARRIVDHLPFGPSFADVVGATACGRLSHKPELIAEALSRLGIPAQGVTMIGDRRMDIEGARHHGMASIGVLWGFGGEAELRAAGADRLARTPAQLAIWLSAPEHAVP